MSRSLTRSQQKLLAIFDVGELRTAPEVADALDLGRRSVYERLPRLVEAARNEESRCERPYLVAPLRYER